MHTINTMKTHLTKLRIHIAPVGFEYDRIVLPAVQMKADKVWLIREANPSKEKASKYIEMIRKDLQKKNIQVAYAESDRQDLFDILKTVKEIFEKEKDNDIYVNVSSGSKIQAISCMMACMMFREYTPTPYYAEPEEYASTQGKPQSSGLKDIVDLPKYEMRKPKRELIEALKIIQEKNSPITKKEMAILAEQKNLITVTAQDENKNQARYASLDKNIIKPLEEQWKFVIVEKIGRNHLIKMTPEGRNAAKFLT